MPSHVIVSCMAPIADTFYPALARFLSRALGAEVTCFDAASWQERMRMLEAGEAMLAHICGAQYVPRASEVEPLAAMAPAGARYGGRPVYFSDVVVRADSPVAGFDGLAGARWAYNEPTSHSGFGVVAAALAARGLTWRFFGAVEEAGSHEAALDAILRGAVDAAAIDSTVLDLLLARDPALAGRIRTVESLGPSPAPPLVAPRALPAATREALRRALASMHDDPEGAQALRAARLDRLAAVDDAWYDGVRRMMAFGRRAGAVPASS